MKLCHWSDLPDGASRGFDPAGHGQDTVIVVRQGLRLHAYANVCPHDGVPMAWRKDRYLNAAGDRIGVGTVAGAVGDRDRRRDVQQRGQDRRTVEINGDDCRHCFAGFHDRLIIRVVTGKGQ